MRNIICNRRLLTLFNHKDRSHFSNYETENALALWQTVIRCSGLL